MVWVGSRYLSSLVMLAVASGLAVPARAQSDKATAASPAAATAPAPGAASSDAAPSGTASPSAAGDQAQPTDAIDPLKRKPNERLSVSISRGRSTVSIQPAAIKGLRLRLMVLRSMPM